MVTWTPSLTMKLYQRMLAEIEISQACIAEAIAVSQPPSVLRFAVKEFCYLQLRTMCEKLALACLIIHGDVRDSSGKHLTEEWNADRIIKGLDKLHSEFFPCPAVLLTIGDAKLTYPQPYTDDHLTKKDITKLYGESGHMLHRGDFKSILKPRTQLKEKWYDVSDCQRWSNKFRNLLSSHSVKLQSGGSLMVVGNQLQLINAP